MWLGEGEGGLVVFCGDRFFFVFPCDAQAARARGREMVFFFWAFAVWASDVG